MAGGLLTAINGVGREHHMLAHKVERGREKEPLVLCCGSVPHTSSSHKLKGEGGRNEKDKPRVGRTGAKRTLVPRGTGAT